MTKPKGLDCEHIARMLLVPPQPSQVPALVPARELEGHHPDVGQHLPTNRVDLAIVTGQGEAGHEVRPPCRNQELSQTTRLAVEQEEPLVRPEQDSPTVAQPKRAQTVLSQFPVLPCI